MSDKGKTQKPTEHRAPDNIGHDTEDRIRTPSQAEGERGLIEQDLEVKQGRGTNPQQTRPHVIDTEDETQSGEDVVRTPSQAEGARDTVEQDLQEKSRKAGKQR